MQNLYLYLINKYLQPKQLWVAGLGDPHPLFYLLYPGRNVPEFKATFQQQ